MKDKNYTAQALKFFDALADKSNKGNIRTCMTLAGYSDNIPTNYVIKTYHEEIVEIAQKLLAASAVRAALSLEDVFDAPQALGAKNTIAAANSILDRAGAVKKTEDVNIKVPSGGILILPAKAVKEEAVDEIGLSDQE